MTTISVEVAMGKEKKTMVSVWVVKGIPVTANGMEAYLRSDMYLMPVDSTSYDATQQFLTHASKMDRTEYARARIIEVIFAGTVEFQLPDGAKAEDLYGLEAELSGCRAVLLKEQKERIGAENRCADRQRRVDELESNPENGNSFYSTIRLITAKLAEVNAELVRERELRNLELQHLNEKTAEIHTVAAAVREQCAQIADKWCRHDIGDEIRSFKLSKRPVAQNRDVDQVGKVKVKTEEA